MEASSSEAQVLAVAPRIRIIPGPCARKRYSKTMLWQLFWDLNKAKFVVYVMHLMVSTNRFEKTLYAHLNDTWADPENFRSWDARHVIYG